MSDNCPWCGAERRDTFNFSCGSVAPSYVTPSPCQADSCRIGILKRSQTWITDHALIDDDATYIVFAIGARPDKITYLYKPEVAKGWQFKRLLANCYAAIPMPTWEGIKPTTDPN